MWTKIDVGILQHVGVLGVPLADPKLIAHLVELLLVPLTERIDVRAGQRLINRNELGPKSETDHGDVDWLAHGVFLKVD